MTDHQKANIQNVFIILKKGILSLKTRVNFNPDIIREDFQPNNLKTIAGLVILSIKTYSIKINLLIFIIHSLKLISKIYPIYLLAFELRLTLEGYFLVNIRSKQGDKILDFIYEITQVPIDAVRQLLPLKKKDGLLLEFDIAWPLTVICMRIIDKQLVELTNLCIKHVRYLKEVGEIYKN